jgi:sterol desaturase/sphingolipid hydroxylase (fatty acid hydroxylase superfamily)
MLSDAITWYTTHAVTVFAVSVLTAVVGETALAVWRRRSGAVTDAATSILSGVAFLVTKNVVAKLAMLTLSVYVYEHWRLFDLDLGNLWVWAGVFVMRDFIYYWVHRAEHRVKVLWASHMVHHSPETIGFATAVRVPWMEAVYKPWLGLWVPLIGFNPVAFIVLDVLAATYAQLYHTTGTRRSRLLDRVLVTPSTHRVHHGSNAEYIDKNFGAVLMVWDHLFGTYEPEVATVRYGLGGEKRIDTPKAVLLGGYPQLLNAVARQRSLKAGVRVLLASPSS